MTPPTFPDYVHPNGQPWLATPRSGPVLPTVCAPAVDGRGRSGAPRERAARDDRGAPYRQAHPMFAHPVATVPEPYPSRGTADLKAIAVILLIVAVVTVAASLAGVRLS